MTGPLQIGDLLIECPTETDHERLQGVWLSFAGRRDAEMVLAGNRFTVRFADGDLYTGTFALDADARPRRMDMLIDDGPDRHRGKLALCIYELDGDTLRWCPAEPGVELRLTEFAAFSDLKNLCLVFRHEEPE
jgi:uncharacterized protein (TIGR03067 family)